MITIESKNWKAAAMATAREPGKYAYNAVQVRANGTVRVSGTDGRQLVTIEGTRSGTDIEAGADQGVDELRLLVPTKAIQRVIGKAEYFRIAGGAVIGADGAMMPADKAELATAAFPDFAALFPTSDPIAVVHLDSQLLASLAKSAVTFLDDAKPVVTVTLYGDDLPVLMTARDDSGASWRALVMPCKVD